MKRSLKSLRMAKCKFNVNFGTRGIRLHSQFLGVYYGNGVAGRLSCKYVRVAEISFRPHVVQYFYDIYFFCTHVTTYKLAPSMLMLIFKMLSTTRIENQNVKKFRIFAFTRPYIPCHRLKDRGKLMVSDLNFIFFFNFINERGGTLHIR